MKLFVTLALLLLTIALTTNAALIAAYWGSWSVYRNGVGQFTAQDIPAADLDILYYGFAGLDPTTYTIKSLDPWADLSPPEGGHYDGYGNAVGLRQKNPKLLVLLSIGGWNEGSVSYSNMASTSSTRTVFITSVVSYLLKYGFNGLDLDWEYPGERGGGPNDKADFTRLVTELSTALKAENLKLTVALGGFRDQIDVSYDFPSIADHVDYFNGMTYTYYTYYDYHKALPSSALYAKSLQVDEIHTANFTASYYVENGVPPEKLLFGVITTAETFTLGDPTSHDIGAVAVNVGQQGPYTQAPGTLSTYEVCDDLKSGGYASAFDSDTVLPYAYYGNQWISYENDKSVAAKAQYAVANRFAGVVLWSIDLDDVRNVCSSVSGGYLLNAIKSVIHKD